VGVEDMNHEPSTSSMVTTTMETTHGLTYSMARAIEVTIWQSVDAVCRCCLAHGSCHWTLISSRSHYSDWGLPAVHANKWLRRWDLWIIPIARRTVVRHAVLMLTEVRAQQFWWMHTHVDKHGDLPSCCLFL